MFSSTSVPELGSLQMSRRPPQKLGAFLHAMQTPVPGAPLLLKNLRVNAAPVIPDPQTKASFVIPDFHFDLPRLCVPEGIAHCLARNPVDFVADDRMQVPRRAFHLHTEERGIP